MKSIQWLTGSAVALLAITTIAFTNDDKIKTPGKDEHQWFPVYDFDAATFKKAPRAFGPFTRWWLPGNDITSEELQREVKALADNGFAGVEVQPLTMGLNPKAPANQQSRIYSWDTPSFYEHLRAIMQQAQQSGITVDMNGGSGWPLGGSFFDPKESMKTLAISDTSLAGGQNFNGRLPSPLGKGSKAEGTMAMMLQKNFIDEKWARIQSVIAARVIKTVNKQTLLDPATIVNLAGKVKDRSLNWQAPAGGEWRIIVSWVIPTGEKPSLIASSKTNYVIDHLNPEVVNKTYDYLLGSRTGLPAYYHRPLRAIFNDSYEFHTDRMISPDFLQVFKAKNGYDIAPYLSAVYQQGYNHPTYLASMYPNARPPYTFSETESWRMMYDYDQVVNEVFKKNFIKTSDQWMQQHGLLHRTQAYGFPIDLIGSAGAADIPEAEQLFAEGSEGYLKLVTSGAHLYHRPVITQESFVSIFRAEMTTPQKIKIWADKSLACGINQLIYHGTPYKYNNGEYGKEGWNTWSSPFMPFINFSTGMNESDPFWKDLKLVNQYLARCQYALRAGKPKTDVLIYMPFIDFTEDQMSMNPEEILYRGYFKGVEPDIKGFGVFEVPKTRISEWYSKLWKTVNELESKGISWEFVNDESLQKATSAAGNITIEGNQYQSLILANLPYINLASAKKINTLSKAGLNLWVIGAIPEQQPSYLNYEANDRLAKQLMEEAAKQKNSQRIPGMLPLNTMIQKIRFVKPVDFSRQITREMTDGSQVKFIWNKSDQWQTIGLDLDPHFTHAYWLNPEDGSIEKNNANTISYRLPPYGSVILYASVKKAIAPDIIAMPTILAEDAKEVLPIDNWTIRVGDITLINSPLIDWRNHERLKYSSDEGIYTASFRLDNKRAADHYILDLGKVFYTATVSINGKEAGKRLFAPYSVDITKLVQPGENQVEVHITTTRRNGFAGEAVKGNPHYAQFKGKEQTLVPSGLAGPVLIKVQ